MHITLGTAALLSKQIFRLNEIFQTFQCFTRRYKKMTECRPFLYLDETSAISYSST